MPPRRQRIHLPPEELNRAIGLLQSGLRQRHVANLLGTSQSVISRAWTRYRRLGQVDRRHGGGRQRLTTPQQDRYLTLQARQNQFAPANVLQNAFQNATGVRVSTQTVRRRLHEAQLRARRTSVCTPLTQQHRQARLQFARQHRRWTIQQWSSVLFTDESKFCLHFLDRRRRVWRRPGECNIEPNIFEHDRFGGPSVMVWGVKKHDP